MRSLDRLAVYAGVLTLVAVSPQHARAAYSSRGTVPTATGNACTAQDRFIVPLKKNGTVKGKGKIVLKLSDSAANKDSDAIKFACLPNPNIATSVCASARQITSTSELIGGPLAMGKV